MKKSLPTDYLEFLEKKIPLMYARDKCEAGSIQLNSLEEIKEIEVIVTLDELPIESIPQNLSYEKYYSTIGLDLVKKTDFYDPEGVLIWFPKIHSFGSWDNQHFFSWFFPDLTWTDLIKNPLPYINSQWNFENGFPRLIPDTGFNERANLPWEE